MGGRSGRRGRGPALFRLHADTTQSLVSRLTWHLAGPVTHAKTRHHPSSCQGEAQGRELEPHHFDHEPVLRMRDPSALGVLLEGSGRPCLVPQFDPLWSQVRPAGCSPGRNRLAGLHAEVGCSRTGSPERPAADRA
jgi:hypothetical protein